MSLGNCIKEVVEKYVIKYSTRDPFKLARLLGIEVQLGNPGCAGCYIFLKNHRYIFLNQSLPKHEMNLVMAHELGHAILHRKENCYFMRNKTLLLNSKKEIEANLFAMELLIDDSFIEENKHLTIEQIARLSGYCEKLIELRLQSN
jgi:Predicted Zn peptidase